MLKSIQVSILVYALVYGSLLGAPVYAQTTEATDEAAKLAHKKAQVVYNLSLFVTWPEQRLNPEQAFFNLCVIGVISTALHNALARAGQRRSIHGHPVKFNTYTETELDLEQLPICHTALIGEFATQEPTMSELLEKLHEQATLTISEREHFAQQGGMIGLLQADQRVRFSINLDIAHQAQLSIRAQLLVMSGTSVLGKNKHIDH